MTLQPVSYGERGDDEDTKDMPPGTKVWIYLRHSEGDNQSLEDQEAAVRRFAREKEWVIDRVLKDEGASGKSTKNRKQFQYMMHLARQEPRPADILIIWSFARFARNQDHSNFYRTELRMHGWRILSMQDDIPGGPLSRIYEALIDWKNEQYLVDLRANTIRGLRFIAERGCLPGGQVCKGYKCRQVPIGTQRDGSPRMGRKPEPDPKVAPLIVKAFEMKARGATSAAIAKETGLYSRNSGSWHHLFRNRAYIGEYEFQGEWLDNVYPSIVSRELFDAVQKRLPKRKKKMKGRYHPRRKGSSYFLANVAMCAHCGGEMEGKSVQGYRYYVCKKHNTSVDLCPESSLIPADALEMGVLETLRDHVLTTDYLQDLLQWTNEHLNRGLEELKLRIDKTRKELAQENSQLRKMVWNFGTMETPLKSTEALLRAQESGVESLRTRMQRLQKELKRSHIQVSPEEIALYLNQARSMMAQAEFFDLRDLSEQLCSRIVMSREECKVELHFPVL